MTAQPPTAVLAALLVLALAGCASVPRAPESSPSLASFAAERAGPSPEQGSAPVEEEGSPADGTTAPVLDAVLDRPPQPAGVWGIVGLRGFAFDQQVAPNGFDFNALFSIDTSFNLWLWRSQGVYLFADSTFWGQRAGAGQTNPSQGQFDFSKREFDMSGGLAWDFFGPLEARAFAYSFNNLNRGTSPTQPGGYADGAALEGRYYFGPTPAGEGFDVARTPYLGGGYYLTKELVDPDGNRFRPGPFLRGRATVDLLGPRCYLYADAQLVATRKYSMELLTVDYGIAARPWARAPRWEIRIGSSDAYDIESREIGTSLYGQVRYLY